MANTDCYGRSAACENHAHAILIMMMSRSMRIGTVN